MATRIRYEPDDQKGPTILESPVRRDSEAEQQAEKLGAELAEIEAGLELARPCQYRTDRH